MDRVPDPELICLALDALRSVNSLDDFYSTLFHDSNGNLRQISGCIEVTRTTLKDNETRYSLFVEKIMGLFTPDGLSCINDKIRHSYILALSKGYPEATITESYIHFSYIFNRALRFVREGKTIPSKSDYNDYEDGRICLHLSLETPYFIVTDDAGARCALNETVSLLGRLNDPKFRTALEIRDSKHLRA